MKDASIVPSTGATGVTIGTTTGASSLTIGSVLSPVIFSQRAFKAS
jgi:hypothetical protein